MTVQSEPQIILECNDAAESAGLSYSRVDQPGIQRRRSGKGFSYRAPDNRKLAIPPAWQSVRISPEANGHIQAFGFDAKGRKQYRYHPKFSGVREGVKFKHIVSSPRRGGYSRGGSEVSPIKKDCVLPKSLSLHPLPQRSFS